MSIETQQHVEEGNPGHERHTHHEQKFIIYVNNNRVEEHYREATGAQIKATAIAQHVELKPDFVLFIVKHGHELEQVDDGQKINLHEHEHFRACAPDDNS